MTTPTGERERIAPTYVVLGVAFVLLVVVGVVTVAMPELANDPERGPDAGVQAPAPAAPPAPANPR